MTAGSLSRLRLAATGRGLQVQLAELHRGLPFTDIEQIDDTHIEDVREVDEHLERWVALPPLKLLKVTVRDPLGGDFLLRHALPPACSLEIPAQPGEDDPEVHGSTVVRSRTRIEPIGLACFTVEHAEPGS